MVKKDLGDKVVYSIYSVNPSETGISLRLIEIFETKADAEIVLKALESVNIHFNTYKIVEEKF